MIFEREPLEERGMYEIKPVGDGMYNGYKFQKINWP
jgi:hypothetical protein